MKNVIICFSLFMFLFVGCNQNDGNNPVDEVTTENDEDVEKDSKMAAAASGACKCMSVYNGNISDRIAKILIKASKSEDINGTLEKEYNKISDPEEKQELEQEMYEMGKIKDENDVKGCMDKLKKKYKLKAGNEKQKKEILKELKKKKGCEIGAALMRIWYAEESKKNVKDDDDL